LFGRASGPPPTLAAGLLCPLQTPLLCQRFCFSAHSFFPIRDDVCATVLFFAIHDRFGAQFLGQFLSDLSAVNYLWFPLSRVSPRLGVFGPYYGTYSFMVLFFDSRFLITLFLCSVLFFFPFFFLARGKRL